MEEERLRKSFDFLGLTQEASVEEVERAYRKLRSLYSEESLATYSLLEDSDRQEKLELLHDAYQRILQSHQHASTDLVALERRLDSLSPKSQVICIDADYKQTPGLFLQQLRKGWALSLKDISARSKVSVNILQNIEDQRFDALPVPVYLRGFLREFAKMVKAPDADALIECFLALYNKDQETKLSHNTEINRGV